MSYLIQETGVEKGKVRVSLVCHQRRRRRRRRRQRRRLTSRRRRSHKLRSIARTKRSKPIVASIKSSSLIKPGKNMYDSIARYTCTCTCTYMLPYTRTFIVQYALFIVQQIETHILLLCTHTQLRALTHWTLCTEEPRLHAVRPGRHRLFVTRVHRKA